MVWKSRENWVSGWVGARTFLVARRELRTFIMAPGELPLEMEASASLGLNWAHCRPNNS